MDSIILTKESRQKPEEDPYMLVNLRINLKAKANLRVACIHTTGLLF